jgi:glucan biosynthesis protein
MPAFSLPFFVDAGASTDRPDLRVRARLAACASLAALTPATGKAHAFGLDRDIRFNAASTLWRAGNLPFAANFFHVGGHGDSVRIHEITTTGVKRLPCDPATFNFGKNKLSPETWDDLGQGGVRFFSNLNSPISFNTTTTQ